MTRSEIDFLGGSVTQTNVPTRAVADFGSARLEAMIAANRDVAMLRRFNASILATNAQIDALLRKLTGHDVSRDPSLKEALAAIEEPDQVRLRVVGEARARSLRAMEEITRERDTIDAFVSEQIRQAQAAFNMAQFPRERSDALIRLTDLQWQKSDISRAAAAAMAHSGPRRRSTRAGRSGN